MPPDVLLGLKEPSGEPPTSRMGKAEDARRLVIKVVKEDEGRSIQRALVKGNLDGNPPYGSKRAGSKWEANLNFMSGKARVNRAVSTYSALFSSVENYADVKTGHQPDNPESNKWNDVISVQFHDLIKTWGQGFDWHMQHRIRQMLVEGYSPVIREQGDNWRFRALDASSIKVPRGTASCLDDRCEFVVLLDTLRTHELYAKIQGAGKDRGWNEAAVKWAIMSTDKTGNLSVGSSQSWERFQQRFQQNDLVTGYADTEGVAVAHVYVKEFAKGGEKSISHFICTQEDLSGKTDDEKGFLFKHVRCYESYQQAVHVFFSNIGDGTWHSVKGLAFDSFKHDVVYNRMMCRLIDRSFIDSTAFWTTESVNSKDKLDNAVIGGAMVSLPAQTKFLQTGVAGNVNGVMDAIRLVTNSANGNTGASNPRAIMREDGKGEMPTLGQVRAQIQQDQQLSNDQIRLDYLAMDRLYDDMFRCAARKGTTDKQAQKFQELCVDAGVPREALDKIISVTANRSSGYGSAAMKDSVVQQMMQVAPMLPEEGKNNLLNYFIMATTENPGLVAYFNPPATAPTPDDALVVLENAAIQQGETPVIYSGQSHVGHMQGHLADTAEKLGPVHDAIEAGQSDPASLQEAYAYLQVMGPHLEAHLAPLRADPIRRQLAKQFELQLANLTGFHGKLRQAIRTALREQQIAAQEGQNASALGELDQAKVRSAQVHDQIAIAKAQNQIQLKQLNAKTNVQLRTADTLHRMNMDKAQSDKAA